MQNFVLKLGRSDVEVLYKEFLHTFSIEPNFKFWSEYIQIVQIMLDFIRPDRVGNWQLHLDSFAAMLPWLTIYDHTNYTKWGPVYLADMKSLEETAHEIHREFQMGNFVVRRSTHCFNQVPVDQSG